MEKAQFLESVGFSQIVPARELTLEEIQEMSQALTHARIEFFIHGALCVSYSGQCYASQAFKGRSANRGDCAQICRLPFDVQEENGETLCRSRHVLSLKDNNQSGNLEALIRAGVRSFKIEGRYKDLSYVKNTTAFYRREIDRFIETHPEFEQESDGRVTLNFEPSLESAFNRGATDYFTNGRSDRMSAADTPKNSGSVIGSVKSVSRNSFTVKTKEELHNGDGLTFFSDTGELSGFLINRAEFIDEGLWEVFTREPCVSIPGLKPGLKLMRNKDAQWVKKMNAETALRKIPIRIEAKMDDRGLTLCAEDGQHHRAEIRSDADLADAKNEERAKEQLLSSLKKLGNSDFTASDVSLQCEAVKFLPASAMNQLRRDLIKKLEKERLAKRPILQKASENSAQYPIQELDYHANVMNSKAREFYEKHGAHMNQEAFEKGLGDTEAEVMRCRYCIRHEMNICPKQAKARGEKIKPTPLVLKSGKIKMTAYFDCKRCEMSLRAHVSE